MFFVRAFYCKTIINLSHLFSTKSKKTAHKRDKTQFQRHLALHPRVQTKGKTKKNLAHLRKNKEKVLGENTQQRSPFLTQLYFSNTRVFLSLIPAEVFCCPSSLMLCFVCLFDLDSFCLTTHPVIILGTTHPFV